MLKYAYDAQQSKHYINERVSNAPIDFFLLRIMSTCIDRHFNQNDDGK